MRPPKALRTKTLPQYLESEDVMARFLAAHGEETTEIARTENTKGERTVRASELQLDAMDDFIARSTAHPEGFYADLKEMLGAARADTFCSILGGAWYDWTARRKGGEVVPLRASVEGLPGDNQGERAASIKVRTCWGWRVEGRA